MAEIIPFDADRSSGSARIPPHNCEAERALLGAIFMQNRAYDRFADFLQPEMFSDPVNARIYMACQKTIRNGSQANPVTLKTVLERDELVAAAGGIKYLAGLAGSAVTAVNALDYAKLIHDLFLRREMIAIGEEMVDRAYESHLDDTAAKQLDAAAGMITGLMTNDQRHKAVSLATAVQEATVRWEDHDAGRIAGISTGLRDLDEEMGLLRGGDLVLLAGGAAQGKTSLAFTMALHAAMQFRSLAGDGKSKRALIFSAEMGYGELAERAMTTYTGVQGPRRRKQQLEQDDWRRITDWQQEIHDLPLLIDDRGAPSLGYMRSRCRQTEHQGGVGLVVVDYVQIMGDDERPRGENRSDQLGRFGNGLKELARTFQCPVIALSSINRGNEARDNKRPIRSDLRGSGELEFAADVIAFVHREEYYLDRERPHEGHKDRGVWEMKMDRARNVAEVIVDKSRNGSSGGIARLNFDRSRTLFSDRTPAADDGDSLSQGRFL